MQSLLDCFLLLLFLAMRAQVLKLPFISYKSQITLVFFLFIITTWLSKDAYGNELGNFKNNLRQRLAQNCSCRVSSFEVMSSRDIGSVWKTLIGEGRKEEQIYLVRWDETVSSSFMQIATSVLSVSSLSVGTHATESKQTIENVISRLAETSSGEAQDVLSDWENHRPEIRILPKQFLLSSAKSLPNLASSDTTVSWYFIRVIKSPQKTKGTIQPKQLTPRKITPVAGLRG